MLHEGFIGHGTDMYCLIVGVGALSLLDYWMPLPDRELYTAQDCDRWQDKAGYISPVEATELDNFTSAAL